MVPPVPEWTGGVEQAAAAASINAIFLILISNVTMYPPDSR
jgi:hypothetical protein